MSSFGAILKRERESRGITLQEISDHTKIGVRLLKSLEEEQLDQLPGGIFDKSFLRQYARYLGLDEDQILKEYLRAIGAPAEPPPAPVSAFTEERPVPFSGGAAVHSGGYFRVILTAVLLGIVVAGAFYGIRIFTERRAAGSAVRSEPPLPVNQTPRAATSPPGDFTATLAGPAGEASGPPLASPSTQAGAPTAEAGAAPAASPAPAERPNVQAFSADASAGLVLQIEARRECWLSISADGQKQWQGTLPPASSRRVEARESFRLTIGDAAAVTLILNGKPLPELGRSGEVRTVTISARGLSPPEP